MPLIITQRADEPIAPAADESVAALLYNGDKLTIEGQTIQDFLESVDWDVLIESILADKELRAHVERFHGTIDLKASTDETFVGAIGEAMADDEDDEEGDDADDEEEEEDADDEDEDDADDEEDDKDTKGKKKEDDKKDESVPAIIQQVPGELAAYMVDEDDLEMLVLHHISNLPVSTLAEKTRRAAIVGHLDMTEAELTEMAKGDFVKIRKSGEQGKNKVVRMSLAMLAKQVIARAKPGQKKYVAPGAKSGGTYTKAGTAGRGDKYNTNGKVDYSTGSKAGVAKYKKFIGGHAAQSAAGAAKSGDKTKKTAAQIKAGATTKPQAAPKKGEPAKKAKASFLSKVKAKVPVSKQAPGKAKKSLLAHQTDAISNVMEGAGLTSRILSRMPNGRRAEPKPESVKKA